MNALRSLRSCVLLLVAVAALAPIAARAQVYAEQEVKAAFLYHFGTYVQWPESSAERDAITIAVLGDDGIVEQLERFLPGRTIARRPVEVRRLDSIEDLAEDELLFIGRSQNDRLGELVAAVGERPVLVVTDSPAGLDNGAMVNFQIIESRVRFEISVPAAQRAGLTLSSRLLSAALRVETAKCGLDCSWRERFVHHALRFLA